MQCGGGVVGWSVESFVCLLFLFIRSEVGRSFIFESIATTNTTGEKCTAVRICNNIIVFERGITKKLLKVRNWIRNYYI